MYELKTKRMRATSTNPWENLALEHYLIENLGSEEVMLFLWQNAHTVVVGRNQNAWRECNIPLLEKEDGKLARRLSGGGAVYHDLGNLNFTFLVDKKHFNIKRQLQVILDALHKLNINAQFSGRNDLLVNGRKFSGNAFYYGQNTSLHHGTLLVDTDFDMMSRYLHVPAAKLKSKGIASVKSRVINLKELNASLTIDKLSQAIDSAFQAEYGQINATLSVDEVKKSQGFSELYSTYASREWRYGKSPAFEISLDHRFEWGGIELCFNVKHGKISEAKIFSDAMNADLIEKTAQSLIGVDYHYPTLASTLDYLSSKQNFKEINDLADWLRIK